jgi:hypothetical protein
MILPHLLDTKAIHYKVELNGTCDMAPLTCREFGLMVAMDG